MAAYVIDAEFSIVCTMRVTVRAESANQAKSLADSVLREKKTEIRRVLRREPGRAGVRVSQPRAELVADCLSISAPNSR